MPNNYATLQNEKSTYKFYLCRMNPARNVTSFLSLDSGTTYTYTFSNAETVNKLTVNGSNYTKTSSSNPSSGQFYFNDSTKQLKVNLGAALTTQVVVAFHYVFLTNDLERYTQEDPLIPSGNSYLWLPRIKSDPSFDASMTNIIFGTFTISNITLDLKNNDSFFQSMLGDFDSFSKKEVVFWHCLNTPENIAFAYKGKIASVTLSNNRVTLQVESDYADLKKTFFSGTNLDTSFLRKANYQMEQENDMIPMPLLFQRFSKYNDFSDPQSPVYNGSLRTASSNGYAGSALFELTDCYKGVNVSVGVGPTANRTWVLFKATGITQVFQATISTVNVPIYSVYLPFNWNLYVITGTGINSINLRVGDSLTLSGTLYRAHVVSVGLQITIATHTLAPAPIAGVTTITRNEISQAQIVCRGVQKNGADMFLPIIEGIDFSEVVDSNGFMTIQLFNNFEADFPEFTAIKTDIESNYELRYVAHRNPNINNFYLNHSKIIRQCIEACGLTCDSTSFNVTDAIDIDVNFSVPFFGDVEFPTYLDVIEKILESVGGYLTLENDGSIGYYLTDAPLSGMTVDGEIILQNSLTQAIDYRDLHSKIIFSNDHGFVHNASAASFLRSPPRLLDAAFNAIDTNQEENNEVKYLHGVDSQKTIKHVIDLRHSTTCFDRIKKFYFNRNLRVSFATKTNFNSKIGDDFTLSTTEMAGGSSKSITAFSKQLSKTETNITGYDLLGV